MEKFIRSLNIYDYAAFRDECTRECRVTLQAWSTWRRGKVSVPAKYHETINKVAEEMFGRKVFE